MKKYQSSHGINFKYAKGNVDIFDNTFHTHYEIYLLLNGAVEFVSNHTRQLLRPYQLILVQPGKYHQFIVVDEMDRYERCVLNVDPSFCDPELLHRAFADKEILTLSPEDRIVQQFAYLTEGMTTFDETDYARVLSAVGTDILCWLKYQTASALPVGGTLRPVSLKLMRYLDEHYTEPIHLTQLADMFHFSVSSLCHGFKEDFGISIKKYVVRKRITAAHLAIGQGASAESVCPTYGFSNYSTFYRAYKQCFGSPPSGIHRGTPKHKNGVAQPKKVCYDEFCNLSIRSDMDD